MTRLVLGITAFFGCLLSLPSICLADFVLSNATYGACLDTPNLPLTFVDAAVVHVSNSTVHVITRLSTAVDLYSGVVFENHTVTDVGTGYSRSVPHVWDVSELLSKWVQPPILADSDVWFELFVRLSPNGPPVRHDTVMRVYRDEMQLIGCYRYGVTVSYQKDDSASNDNAVAAAAAARPWLSAAVSVKPPPSSSSYAIADVTWYNCRASDPVQFTQFNTYISLDTALTESYVLQTDVDVVSGALFGNATLHEIGGRHRSGWEYELVALDTLTVQYGQLPWLAGSSGLPLAATYNISGMPSVSRSAFMRVYDDAMIEVGCLFNNLTVLAPAGVPAVEQQLLKPRSIARLLNRAARTGMQL